MESDPAKFVVHIAQDYTMHIQKWLFPKLIFFYAQQQEVLQPKFLTCFRPHTWGPVI